MNTKDKVNVLKKLKNKIKKKMSELRIVWNLLDLRNAVIKATKTRPAEIPTETVIIKRSKKKKR